MVAVVIFLWQGSAIFPTKGYAIALTTSPTISDSAPSSAAVLFEQNCAGCHVNGGNVIRRGKNLKKKAMVRNGYSDVDAIAQIITNGKGIMSAYGDRLNEEEIGAIARPGEIQFTEALPKTRSGKIIRRFLRNLASGEDVVGDATTMEDQSVLEKLRQGS